MCKLCPCLGAQTPGQGCAWNVPEMGGVAVAKGGASVAKDEVRAGAGMDERMMHERVRPAS